MRVAIYVLIGLTIVIAVMVYRRWKATSDPIAALNRAVDSPTLGGAGAIVRVALPRPGDGPGYYGAQR